MPRYHWKCKNCSATIEVSRRMRDSGIGPIRPCPRCKSEIFKKKIMLPNVVTREGHNSPFPLKVNGLEKVLKRDKNGDVVSKGGLPVVEYRDVVFKSAKHQREWLAAKGKVLTQDFVSPSTGTSMKGHYDIDLSPPNKEAERLAEKMFFVEDPNISAEDVEAQAS